MEAATASNDVAVTAKLGSQLDISLLCVQLYLLWLNTTHVLFGSVVGVHIMHCIGCI